MSDKQIRLRFAPSPTGFLHIGGARTALFNWLWARQQGGVFVLRIEDTDEDRSTLESTQAILDGLLWLGLDWDEGPDPDPLKFGQSIGNYGPYFQSERAPRHLELIGKLLEEGKAYYCHATPEEMTEPDGKKKKLFSPYRDASPEEQRRQLEAANGELAVRFKCPGNAAGGPDVSWQDTVRGNVTVNCKDIGDFVIAKRNGKPLYNFAVVCDDAEMQITHVLRGEDHTSNTPKQLLLYKALGFLPPIFGHVPLIVGMDRAKLSKRHGATAVGLYQKNGTLPEALVNFLVLIGWAPKDNREDFSLSDLVEVFNPADIGKSSGAYNNDKLSHFNGLWIRKFSVDELFERLKPWLREAWITHCGEGYAKQVCALYQDKLLLLSEIEANAWYFFDAPKDGDAPVDEATGKPVPGYYNPKMVEKFITGNASAPSVLGELHATFSTAATWDEATLSLLVDAFCEKSGLGKGKVMQPWRVALTGDKISPGFFDLVLTLGKEETLARVAKWL